MKRKNKLLLTGICIGLLSMTPICVNASVDSLNEIKKLDIDFDNNKVLDNVHGNTYVPLNTTHKYVTSLKGNAYESNNSKLKVPFEDMEISEKDSVITIAFLFKWEGEATSFRPFFFNAGLTSGRQNAIWVRNGVIGFTTGNSDIYGKAGALTKNKYYSIVAEFNSGDVTKNKLYIDGVKQSLSYVYGSSSKKDNTWDSKSSLSIAGTLGSDSYNIDDKTILDEIKVFTKSLTQAEVNEITNTYKIPILDSRVINNTYPRLNWTTEILSQNTMWRIGYEPNEQANVNRVFDSKNGMGNGGQRFSSNVVYSGNNGLYTPKTLPDKGNWVSPPYIRPSAYNHIYYEGKSIRFKNTDKISISYRIRADDNTKVEVMADWQLERKIYSFNVKTTAITKKGSNVIKVADISKFERNLWVTLDSKDNVLTKNYNKRIDSIDVNAKTITLSGGVAKDIPSGTVLKYRKYVWAFDDCEKEISPSSKWQLVNMNTSINQSDYINWSEHDIDLRHGWSAEGDAYLDDLTVGYATKVRLYRDGSKIYEGYESQFDDKLATDKYSPNQVSKINSATYEVLNASNFQRKIKISFDTPKDLGTSYKYQISSVDNAGKETPKSETISETVTSGIKGYSFVIDKSPTTEPGNTVNATSTSISKDITDSGVYYLHIKTVDNAGNVSQTMHYKIPDNTNPDLNLSLSTNAWTKGQVSININACDYQSGIEKVKLPNGTYITPSTGTYKIDTSNAVSGNGTYTFIAYDFAGNTTTKSITVSNIDKTNPTINITGNPTTWTKNNVTLTVSGSDSQSGVKSITLPNGTIITGSSTTYTVSSNGTYTFKVTDNAGNEISQSVTVDKIDKTNPTINITGNPTSWTKNNVTLTISGSDSQSGIKSITLPNGNIVNSSSATYTVTENGTYTFKAIDNVGNEVTQSVTVSKIDKTNPTISITGNPTNWVKSATLTISGADSQSGVKSITLPNGNIVNSSNTTFTVTENGNYTFKVIDNVGNEVSQSITVSKIDKANPTINITGNPTSWTKNNVTLTISGSDNQSGVKSIILPNGNIVNSSSTTYTITDNGTYTFKAIDNVGNEVTQSVTVSKIDKTNPTISITGNPTNWVKSATLTIGGSDSQSGIKSITLPNGTIVTGSSTTYTVTENGTYTFKIIDNVGNEISQSITVNKIDKTNPTINITGNPTSWTKNNVTLTISGSDGQSGIKSIILPNGNIVNSSSATFTVTENGTYTFKVIDNAGNEISQSVTVNKIDKTNPTINITGNPTSWTKNNVTLTVSGSDNQSGVKSITLPNGTIVTGSSTTYTITENGTYTFKAIDNVGNEISQSITVNKIDKTNPTINITGNPTSWTKNNVTLSISGSDSQSGVKSITLPNGNVINGSSTTYTVSSNGNYTFKVTDNAGNEVSQSITVSKIDKTNPTIIITGNPTNWVKSATLTITSSDSQSGVKSITLPNGNVINGSNTTYTVSENGTYTFKVIDNVGNEISQSVTVNKIDTTNPIINITGNPTSWTNNDVTLTISGSDSQSGVKSITLPNGNVVNSSSITYTVSNNGAYIFKAIDNVGNETSQSVTVSKIDKVKPNNNYIKIELK